MSSNGVSHPKAWCTETPTRPDQEGREARAALLSKRVDQSIKRSEPMGRAALFQMDTPSTRRAAMARVLGAWKSVAQPSAASEHPPPKRPPPKRPSFSGAAQPATPPGGPHGDTSSGPSESQTKLGARWMPQERPPVPPSPHEPMKRFCEILVTSTDYRWMSFDGTPTASEDGNVVKAPPPADPRDIEGHPVRRISEAGVPKNYSKIIVATGC